MPHPKNHSTKDSLLSLREAYISGEYDKYRQELIKEKAKFTKDIFHYNLGIYYYKTQQFPIARFHFEKSLHEGHLSTQLLHNLNLSKKQLPTAISIEEKVTPFEKAINTFSEVPASYVWGPSLLLILIMLLGIKSKIRKEVKSYVMIALVIFLGCLPYLSHFFLTKDSYGAITLDKIIVREGPSQIFSKIGELPAGLKLRTEKSKDGWFFVHSPKKFVGWIEGKDLGLL